MILSTMEYHDYENNSMGYCPECDDFTREMTEPDADGTIDESYLCPDCGGPVLGSMNALMDGHLEIED